MIPFLCFFFLTNDFVISADVDDQSRPVAIYAHDNYNVFWSDMRYYPPDRSIFAARVTSAGNVLDPDGKIIFRDRAVAVDAAWDGVNFLAVIQDSC